VGSRRPHLAASIIDSTISAHRMQSAMNVAIALARTTAASRGAAGRTFEPIRTRHDVDGSKKFFTARNSTLGDRRRSRFLLRHDSTR
jgi:hypothetical protein